MVARGMGLFGATMREIGILVVVFAPLESYLRGPDPPMIEVWPLAIGGLILITAGIMVEVYTERNK